MTSMRFRSFHSTTQSCRQCSHESSITAPKSNIFPQKSPMFSQQSLIFLQKSPNFRNTIPMCRQYCKRALYFRNSILMCRFALCAWPACTCMLACRSVSLGFWRVDVHHVSSLAAFKNSHVHAYTHTHTYVLTHTHTRTHTLAHAHTHTHEQQNMSGPGMMNGSVQQIMQPATVNNDDSKGPYWILMKEDLEELSSEYFEKIPKTKRRKKNANFETELFHR